MILVESRKTNSCSQSISPWLTYHRKWVRTGFSFLLLLGVLSFFAIKGDSLYGKVTAVKSATDMTFTYDSGSYNIRLAGIGVPQVVAGRATEFVSKLILGKNARMRFEGRLVNDQRKPTEIMMVRLFTDDSIAGIKEVAIELLRAGLALRQKNYDYKYGELAAAEKEAQAAKRGYWGRRNG